MFSLLLKVKNVEITELRKWMADQRCRQFINHVSGGDAALNHNLSFPSELGAESSTTQHQNTVTDMTDSHFCRDCTPSQTMILHMFLLFRNQLNGAHTPLAFARPRRKWRNYLLVLNSFVQPSFHPRAHCRLDGGDAFFSMVGRVENNVD